MVATRSRQSSIKAAFKQQKGDEVKRKEQLKPAKPVCCRAPVPHPQPLLPTHHTRNKRCPTNPVDTPDQAKESPEEGRGSN